MMNIFKLTATFFTLILIGQGVFAQNFGMETIRYNGSPDQMVNLVVMGDGYTLSQQEKFIEDVKKNIAGMLLQSPWRNYTTKINVYAIKVVSNVSGAANTPSAPIDNYFGSSFNTNNIERLLYPTKLNRIYGVLNSNAPFFDIGLIIVNDDRYGGGGGTFATFSTHPSSVEIMIHELGHSFTRLADEYWAGSQFARETSNMTKDSNPVSNRWKNFLNQNGIGIYPHEESPTWFRPHQNCKMRFLGRNFCTVCTNELNNKIESLTASAPLQRPVAFFGADKLEIMDGQQVRFFDFSNESPTEWVWTFEGGNPQTSNLQNPTITFPTRGLYQVSLTVTNAVGTSTTIRTEYIKVNSSDTEPPVIRVKNLTVNLDESGLAKISAEDVDTGTTDNKGIGELSLSKSEFNCNDVGANQITFKAIDINGNESTEKVTITVREKILPTVKTKNFILMLDEEGNGTLKPEDIDDGSFDNCKIESMSLSKSTFGREDNGDNEVTLTVTDIHGNECTGTATVRVEIILSSPENKENISIYPNPSQGIIHIAFPKMIDPELKYIEILDSKGTVLRTLNDIPTSGNLIPIDVNEFANGVYLVRLTSFHGIQNLKFMVKK